jgi:hypothetical protein
MNWVRNGNFTATPAQQTQQIGFSMLFYAFLCLLSLLSLLIEQQVLSSLFLSFFDFGYFGYFGHAVPGQNGDSAFSDAASPDQTNASEGGSSGSQAGRPNNGVVHKVVAP